MKILSKHFFSFMVLMLVSLIQLTFIVPATSAQNLWDNQVGVDQVGQSFGAADRNSTQDPRSIIAKIINVSFTMLGIIFVALMVFSGYQWMTAGGDEDQVTKAKGRIKNAIIGLVILLLAWSITTFVLRRVIGINSGSLFYME